MNKFERNKKSFAKIAFFLNYFLFFIINFKIKRRVKFVFNKFIIIKKITFDKRKIIQIFAFILKSIEINLKFIIFLNFKKTIIEKII